MATSNKSRPVKYLLLGLLGLVLVCIVGELLFRKSTTTPPPVPPSASTKQLNLVHPVFGAVHQTIAIDEPSLPVVFSIWDQVKLKVGLALPPPPPTRINLLMGQTQMWWSAGGYLYCDLVSNLKRTWQFAPCAKTNLMDVAPQDFDTTFVSQGDNIGGTAAFGTNWLKHGLHVQPGQLVLARLESDPTQIFALGIVEQSLTNAVVHYFKKER